MNFTPSFYKSAAVCSMLSALTTALLIFLPDLYAPIEGFDGRMERVRDPAYVLRSWVYLLHPFLVLTAALGIAMRIRTASSAAAVIGLLGFTLWAFTEAGQQTLTLFAFDKWRIAYSMADETTREQTRANTVLYDALWDAMYFLLLIGFAIGNLFLGLALASIRDRFTRIVGCFLLAAAALTIALIAGELQWFSLPEPLATWSYPAIQPLGRALIGVWLWRAADERDPLPPLPASS